MEALIYLFKPALIVSSAGALFFVFQWMIFYLVFGISGYI